MRIIISFEFPYTSLVITYLLHYVYGNGHCLINELSDLAALNHFQQVKSTKERENKNKTKQWEQRKEK